ncbi:WD repeat-containing protein 5 homolog [Striga asiatica]|uniref:WD repeat-containing protein 5 homolog n=1 Tax=Striga asiatica TaxID=4170 RepID=A0A5A7QWE1_STRAF|nr:WD repeat-containing protein 5 homolog [Striga asiatica]
MSVKRRALLWDIRRFSEPTVELSKHEGPIKLLHLDRHNIVTGGPYDSYIKVWETDTGEHLDSLISSGEDGKQNYTGCSTMAVDRCRIVTGDGVGVAYGGCRILTGDGVGVAYGGNSLLRFKDFRTATWHVPSGPYEPDPSASKFWGSLSDIDRDSEESVGFL